MPTPMRVLGTPHEELLVIKKKLESACDLWNNYRYNPVSLFGRKKWEAATSDAKKNYYAVVDEYFSAFNKILKENHGVDPADIVKQGDGLAEAHEFTVLLDRKIRSMKAVTVGKRIVFFLDDTALGEDEKASYAPQ